MPSTVTLCDISSEHLPSPVSYAVLAPSQKEALPLCILLLGAGGTRDSMFDLQPLFDGWAGRTVPPLIIATPTSGLDYYIEDPAGPIRWDSFLAGDFVPHLRSTCNVSDSTVIAGISGGGYGALKLAFTHPHLFAAVAAMQPMLEPALRESDVGPRNVSITLPAVHRSWSVPHAILRSGSQTIPPTGLAGMRSNFAIPVLPFTSRPVTRTSSMPTMALNSSTACCGISTSHTNTILSVVLTTAAPPCAPACTRCLPGSAPCGIPRR